MGEEQDRMLPIANVGRIMKQILPEGAKISKEAKERMQECATEFVSFVTSEASDKCQKENRKTVNGDDICWALTSLGLDDYAEAIIRYLHKYREAERERANQNKALNCSVSKDDDDDDDDGGGGDKSSYLKRSQSENKSENSLGFREFFVKDNGGSSSKLF